MYGKKGDDPVSKLFLSLWEISCLMFMKTRLAIFWKNIFLSSELKTVSSFYIKFKVCVCGFFFSVIIRAKMLYIIPDSGIQVNLVFSNQEPLDIAQEIMLLI